MADPSVLAPGTRLNDRYEIGDEIGRGGISVVYEAVDTELDAPVAVKLLVPPPAVAHIARERMRREVQAVRALRHPNIVRLFDLLEDGPWTFVIMERIRGRDLHSWVGADGRLASPTVARVGAEIADALALAHKSGVLHRDVKPQNILIDEEGRSFLTDFGSARIEGQATLTQVGSAVGTLAYMAPEVIAGQRADARSDVFALGTTLYFALTGRLPKSSGPSLPADPAPEGHHPREVNGEVPDWLDAAVAIATRAEPGERFRTAARFAEVLASSDGEGAAVVVRESVVPQRCLICGGPEPLGLAVCPSCGGKARARAGSFVVVQPGRRRSETRARIERLASLLDEPADSAALAEVALGRKPLIRVPPAQAAGVVAQLARRDLPAGVVPFDRAWRVIPRSFKSLVAAILAAGCLVGFAVGAWFLWTSVVLAAGLFALAYRSASRPLLVPQLARSPLPPRVEARVVEVMTEMPPGAARSLFADLVHLARERFAMASSSSVQPVMMGQLSDLLITGCEAARELGSLDQALQRFEEQRTRFAKLPDGWMTSLAQCEKARDCLVQRLLESTAALGVARGQDSIASDGVAEHLEGLTRELAEELRIQAEAAKEAAELVGSAPA